MARFRTHSNPFNYFKRIDPINLQEVLPGYSGTIEVEVGFGQGLFIEEYAQRHPHTHIVGIEVRTKVVEAVQERIQKQAIPNVHLVHGNGEIVIADGLENNSISRLFIFHPDPWFKKRHHNRRILSIRFLNAIRPKLQVGCRMYLSTDVQILFEEMKNLLAERSEWQAIEDPLFWEENYRTNWQLMSEKDHRNSHCATYYFLG
jgi:tRNA (guanine-N7-)-methyltransferase